ncbi:flagellar biosynthetic protein FliO [Desulfovibrio sp. TomC]|uniref:flagellar biosynthetic protein FliO n=1 Tax=Desulfovibrio sp. TomC TaxID=1562888 RepID=UPI0005735221|nr:flagellar biosynthetic protein FliO [Desulfovibrio sp. TomC]KHK03004.1 Flagellar biosynthesis protein FliO [Desulfovibrio sp. TomC]
MPDPTGGSFTATEYGLTGVALKMGLTLLIILAFIFAAFWLLKRYGQKFGIGPKGRGGKLRLLDHLPVGPRKSIVVVRFLNKDLVLGITEQSITFLTETEVDDAAATDFADTLAARTQDRDAP